MSRLIRNQRVKPVTKQKITAANFKQKMLSISTEALAYHGPGLAIMSKLSDMFDGTKEYLAENISHITAIPFTLKKNKVAKILSGYSYTEFTSIPVPCIPGQTVAWMDVLDALEFHLEVISGLDANVFEPFNAYLGQILNDPESMGNQSLRPNVSMSELDQIKLNYESCFGSGMGDEVAYGVVVKRNADWATIRKRFDAILEKSKKEMSVAHITEQVDRTNANVTKLFKDVQNDNLNYTPTASAVDYLTKMLYHSAENVAAFALYNTYVNQMSKCIEDTEAKFVSTFK